MASLVGKRVGKIVYLGTEYPPEDEPRRFKYRGQWYRIKCDCGTEKLIPTQGAVGMKSCGCARLDFHHTSANETVQHFPNHVKLGSVKDKIYRDI